ncbi:class C sortase [Trueperella pecoris]|uniref:Class C sortase n=1 Tax=Trueperella pecoris TaxID=2733571 RepID=A0A7M1QUJ2_9ACTO|nr:class C sortase [Trueperella pecoris]QOQ38040.1 class C sortase [Trueperella pecoris]QOR45516.1 class C sortase [Trueperella pecoris]
MSERTKSRKGATIALIVVFLGILSLLYPIVSTHYNNYRQQQFAAQYGNKLQEIDASDRSAALASAQEYNKKLPGIPILDPWLTQVANPASPAYTDYQKQLSLTGDIIARVRVPSVDIDLPVRHDTTPDIIDKGVGHLYGTSLPVGGENTHAVLTTHTGLSSATLFDNLPKVKEGELIFVDVLGQTLAYRVDQIKTVLPNDIEDLAAEAGRDLLTLFTCTPYAVNTHRLLVRGERVALPDDAVAALSAEPSVFVMQGWMWGLLAVATIAIALFIAMLAHSYRKQKKDEEDHAIERALDGIDIDGPTSKHFQPHHRRRSQNMT